MDADLLRPLVPNTSKIQQAISELEDAETGRSYNQRLRFYKQIAFNMAENDPNGVHKYAMQAKKQLQWI